MIDGHGSDGCVVEHGPREGSVLSSVLYAIFINEMAKWIGAEFAGAAIGCTHVKVLTYTDDAAIISDNEKDLQNGLGVAQRFADQSRFEFLIDTGKSDVIVFGDDRDYPYEWKPMEK